MAVAASTTIRAACLVGFAAVVIACAGCQTTTRDSLGRERTTSANPRPVPPPPTGTRPQQMMLVAGVPSDADANGFPDTIPIVVYLFAPVDVYALPLVEPGEFRFELRASDGGVIGEWLFDREATADAAQRLPPGRGYVFGLRLAPGVDRVENQPAALTAQFTAARDGRQIASSGSATVRIGAGARPPEPFGP